MKHRVGYPDRDPEQHSGCHRALTCSAKFNSVPYWFRINFKFFDWWEHRHSEHRF